MRDDEVAALLQAGDECALAWAYERWAGSVHGIATRALGSPQDAEDVTQQVFVDAWTRRHAYRPWNCSAACVASSSSPVGRVYNTLALGGFDAFLKGHATTAPRIEMPPPGVSAIDVWRELDQQRPRATWEAEGFDLSRLTPM